MKVLIVDDSKAMRLIVRRTLRQAGFENLEVEDACNGKEALEVIARGAPDLVLCDWNMPEMSGIELLTHLKAQGSAIRFGFVTSEGTPPMRERAKEEGALFLIAKPFTPEQFRAVLAPVLC